MTLGSLSRWRAALIAPLLTALAGCAPTTRTERESRGAEAPVIDSLGEEVRPLADSNAPAIVLFFLRMDCPIANRYAPEIERLSREFTADGADVWLVYPGGESPEAIERRRREYALSSPALRDPEHRLVAISDVKVTPEAAVFDSRRELAYSGRIDDRYVDFGQARPEPTRRDLQDAVEAVLRGETVYQRRVPAVGCPIAESP